MGTIQKRKVDVHRGEMKTVLSREWASRPDDEKFLSLEALLSHVRARAEQSFEDTATVRDLRFDGLVDDDRLVLLHNGRPVDFNHWSLNQVCRYAGAPASYLRTLPAHLAATCLQISAITNGAEQAKLYINGKANVLRAATGPNYGRVTDAEVVGSIIEIAKASDVQWKVPGCMDWSTGCYDPTVPVTKETTTLFASDRDVALFICDDLNPIEVGLLPNGDPDLMFRGFMARNSEVGNGYLDVLTMYLRGVCANRCLWGVEGFQQIKIRHNSWAPEKFREQLLPAMATYHNADPMKLANGVKAAKEPIASLARGTAEERREEQTKFLLEMGFGPKMVVDILGHEAPGTAEITSVWDVAQKVTAFAQTLTYHDKRLELETVASDLLDRVSV